MSTAVGERRLDRRMRMRSTTKMSVPYILAPLILSTAVAAQEVPSWNIRTVDIPPSDCGRIGLSSGVSDKWAAFYILPLPLLVRSSTSRTLPSRDQDTCEFRSCRGSCSTRTQDGAPLNYDCSELGQPLTQPVSGGPRLVDRCRATCMQ
jgi:hypothetical protein